MNRKGETVLYIVLVRQSAKGKTNHSQKDKKYTKQSHFGA